MPRFYRMRIVSSALSELPSRSVYPRIGAFPRSQNWSQRAEKQAAMRNGSKKVHHAHSLQEVYFEVGIAVGTAFLEAPPM